MHKSIYSWVVIFAFASAFLNAAEVKPIEVGAKVPDFALPNAMGEGNVALMDARGKRGTAIVFIATGCPYSNAFNHVMADLARRYEAKGIKFVGVNSNKTEPMQKVANHASSNNLDFAVLKDEGSVVADRFGAVVTPEVFLIDDDMTLRYHGALGNSRQPTTKASQANGDEIVQAMEAMLSGNEIPVKKTKMFGCTIKR